MEDNDDGDDTATGNCGWVLSIRDKPKLSSLAFKPTFAKMEVGEDATDAVDATAFCTTAASTRNTKESALPFAPRPLQKS